MEIAGPVGTFDGATVAVLDSELVAVLILEIGQVLSEVILTSVVSIIKRKI